MKKIDWKLCLVADADYVRGRDLLDLLMRSVDAGATLVQLRAKSLSSREFLDLCLAAQTKLSKRGIPLIINDRLDIALAGGASGVHLGQEDMPLHSARTILGHDRIIGISVSSVEEALRAWHGAADYVGAGPVFATSTKECGMPPLGPEGLKKIREAIRIPILAIGGITPDNARQALESGADGLAVISAILGAEDAASATAELLKVFALRA
ncbi:MAG: thiamine phosphate synthase [Candidatus Aminicenantes bacterium]|nr:thiamine phosphate synthase [Candidatus Aminicenantes bacterium]